MHLLQAGETLGALCERFAALGLEGGDLALGRLRPPHARPLLLKKARSPEATTRSCAAVDCLEVLRPSRGTPRAVAVVP